MLTYNTNFHLDKLFSALGKNVDKFVVAKDITTVGRLIKAKSLLLALDIKEAQHGLSYKPGTPNKFYWSFTPEQIGLVVKSPVWCDCPEFYNSLVRNRDSTWPQNHIGFVSMIFLYNETLYEAISPIQKNEGIGKDLLEHMSIDELLQCPEIIFLPLIEPAFNKIDRSKPVQQLL